jgi:integrase
MAGLTVLKVKHAKPGFHSDGRGLYLLVRPSGGRFWVLRIQYQNRRRDLGLGSARDISLEDARAAAQKMREQVKQGAQLEVPVLLAGPSAKPSRKVRTFESATRECYEALKEGWKDQRRRNWLSAFERYVFPTLGSRAIDEVDSADVRDVLAPIWLKIPETARRLLQRIGTVLDFAHISGWRGAETSLRSVRKGLPRQNDRGGHYEAMPFAEAPAFVQSIGAMPETVGRDALCFTILTAVRSNETRFAVWPEFDLDKGVWTIPAERMKAGETHAVPLSEPALSILRRRWEHRHADDGLVFSKHGTRPISDMTITAALREAGVPKYTVHGFRSTFTDWSSEKTNVAKEVADKALAHRIPDAVEAAYRRTDFFEKRRRLMNRWAAYLLKDAPASDETKRPIA